MSNVAAPAAKSAGGAGGRGQPPPAGKGAPTDAAPAEERAGGSLTPGLFPPHRTGRSTRMIGEVVVDLGFADRESVDKVVELAGSPLQLRHLPQPQRQPPQQVHRRQKQVPMSQSTSSKPQRKLARVKEVLEVEPLRDQALGLQQEAHLLVLSTWTSCVTVRISNT